jgi:predicted 3-demethylubiquinone-9 3-methyltransferase (glyoxalase superfamily)
MAPTSLKLTTCLWFDGKAEEAANYYVSIFPNSRITHVQRYPSDGAADFNKVAHDAVLVVEFELDGHRFVGLNGGPNFRFDEAVSFQIDCDTQEEVDYYWDRLSQGGDEKKQQCSWVADKFGLSWQVVPKQMKTMLADKDRVKAGRAMDAMMDMKKLDIAALEKAFEGK